MSNQFESLAEDLKRSAQWFIKISEGNVYGPVSIAILCDWAAQGRIVVGNLVSPDNKTWIPAEGVPQLNMTWVAGLKSGRQYGPFNLAAVPILVQRGKLSRTATIQNCATGEMLSVSSVLKYGVEACLNGTAGGTQAAPAAQPAARPPQVKAETSPTAPVPQEPVKKSKTVVVVPTPAPVAPPPAAPSAPANAAAMPVTAPAVQEPAPAAVAEIIPRPAAKPPAPPPPAAPAEKPVPESRPVEKPRKDDVSPVQSPQPAQPASEARPASRARAADEVPVKKTAEIEKTVPGDGPGTSRHPDDLRGKVHEVEQAGDDREAELRLRVDQLEAEVQREKAMYAEVKAKAQGKELERGRQAKLMQAEISSLASKAIALETELKQERNAAAEFKSASETRLKELTDRVDRMNRDLEAERARAVALEAEAGRERASVEELEKKLASEKAVSAEASQKTRAIADASAGQIVKFEQVLQAHKNEAAKVAAQLEERVKAYAELEQRSAGRERDLAEQIAVLKADGAKQMKALASELQREREARSELEKSGRALGLQLEEQAKRSRGEVEAVRARISGLEADLAGARKELDEARGHAASLEAATAEKLGRVHDLEKQLAAEKVHREETAQKSRGLATEFAVRVAKLEQALKESRDEAAKVSAELEGQKKSSSDLEKRSAARERELVAQIDGLKADGATQVKVLAELRKQLETEKALREEAARKSRGDADESAGKIGKLEQALQLQRDEAAAVGAKLEEQKRIRADLEKRSADREQELAGRIQGLMADGTEQMKALTSELQRERAARMELENKIRGLEQELGGLRDESARAGRALEEARKHVASMESSAGGKQARIAELENQLTVEKELRDEAIRRSRAAAEESAGKLAKLEQVLQAQKEDTARAAAMLSEHKAGLAALGKSSQDRERELVAQIEQLRVERAGLAKGSSAELQRERDARVELEKKSREIEEGFRKQLAEEKARHEEAAEKGRARQAELANLATNLERAVVDQSAETERVRKQFADLKNKYAALESRAATQAVQLPGQVAGVATPESGRVKELEAELQREQAMYTELEGKILGLEKERSENAARMKAEAGERIAALEAEFGREREAVAAARADAVAQARVLNDRIQKSDRELADSRKQIAVLEAALGRERDAAAGDRKTLAGQIKALNERVQQFDKDLSESQKQVADLKTELAGSKTALEAGQKLAGQAAQDLGLARAEIASAASARVELARRLLGPPAGGPGWYMKGEDASVYGPVDLQELWNWACQCRIGAETLVSQDKTAWSRAESIAELGIQWLCNMPDGANLGPVNPFAFRELVESGEVNEASGVVNCLTGEKVTVRDLLNATEDGTALRRQVPPNHELTKALHERISRLETDIAESQKVISVLKSELAEAARVQAQAKEAAVKGLQGIERAGNEPAAAVETRLELVQRLASPAARGQSWHMKGEDGSVYGPVDLPELWSWACQCRVDAETLVSQDKATWIRAGTIPELRIEWVCNRPDGAMLGPLNPFAFRELAEAGEVDRDSRVSNRVTGEAMTVGELARGIEDGKILGVKLPGSAEAEWRQRCSTAEAHGKRLEEQLERERGLLEAERTQRQKLERELAAAASRTITPSVPPPPAGRAGPADDAPPKRLSERFRAAAQKAQNVKG